MTNISLAIKIKQLADKVHPKYKIRVDWSIPQILSEITQASYLKYEEDEQGNVIYAIWVTKSGEFNVLHDSTYTGFKFYRAFMANEFPRPCKGEISNLDDVLHKVAIKLGGIITPGAEFDIVEFPREGV